MYLRQGVNLEYKPEGGIVYNDKYSTPILNLLVSKKTLTIPEVEYRLDMGGYIGRHKVRRMYKNGCYPLNDIRISVELIWSNFSYSWPHQGVFSLDFMRIVRNEGAVKLSPDLQSAAKILYDNCGGGAYMLKKYGGCSTQDALDAMKELRSLRLLDEDDCFRVTEDSELQEVLDNIITL